MSNAKRELKLYPGKIGTVPLYPGYIGNYKLYPGYIEIDMPVIPDSNNVYPIWWTDTVTIYNKYTDPQTDLTVWYKTIIKDCFWKSTGTEVKSNTSAIDSKFTICRIPKDTRYKDKTEWLKLSDETRPDYFTINQGDIIVKGECDFDINEYQSGTRSTDLLAKYSDCTQCITINQFTDDTGVGRNNEHYFVRG